MLIGLKQQLEEGKKINLTLMFDDGSERQLSVPVREMGAMPMNMKEHMHDKDHKHEHKKHHKHSSSSGG
jgi:copper(I)-binding protein